MKYCFLIAGLGSGGAERVVSSLANYLCKNNLVSIITFTNKKPFYNLDQRIQYINIMYTFKNKKGIFRLIEIPKVEILRLKSIISIIKHINPDFIISFCFTANILNVLQKIIYGNVTTIVSERNDPTSYSRIVQFICKKFYRKSDLLVCQSEFVKRYYKNCVSCVLPNPLMIQQIPHNTNKEYDSKKIVSVGRLVTQKNQKCLIDAFALINKSYPECVLEIYGDGPLQFKLLEYIDKLGLTNQVRLMGAKIEVLEWIKDAELFLFSSNYEGFPNALIEAMAVGLPIVTTDFSPGIAKELIVNGKNGYIVKKNDYIDIANKAVKILKDEELKSIMSINNKKVKKIYSINNIGQRWIEKLNEIKE